MLNAGQITDLHDSTNRAWHLNETFQGQATQLSMFVLLQHRANFDLWHEEDKARNPQATDAAIAAVKHSIDEHNQERNDYVEQIDALLLHEAGTQNRQTPLHSETPGLIIDRLSILSLKIHHTAEQAERASASEDHRARNRERLRILAEQRADLAACLDDLWAQVRRGERHFKLYRQLKMYNDPELNPEVYSASSSSHQADMPPAEMLPAESKIER